MSELDEYVFFEKSGAFAFAFIFSFLSTSSTELVARRGNKAINAMTFSTLLSPSSLAALAGAALFASAGSATIKCESL